MVTKTAGWKPALPVDALCAGQLGADARCTAFRRRHPRAALPRRIVAHMLRMAAFEVGDPVAGVILVEIGDFAAWARGHCSFMQFWCGFRFHFSARFTTVFYAKPQRSSPVSGRIGLGDGFQFPDSGSTLKLPLGGSP
jgi:hypothetical protein